MALNTFGDLITFSLRTAGINGIGQTPVAEDFNDAMVLLHALLAGWQRKRWLVPNLVDMPITSTGAQSYSIGAFRPAKIDAAYARFLPSPGGQTLDFPLTIIQAREDYSEISLKSLSTIPSFVFYDTAWPDAQLFFWPIPPSGQYELHVLFVSQLTVPVNLTDAINLPPEYEEALIYSLAVRLAMNYGLEPRPSLVGGMRQALNVLRMSNSQPRPLHMPAGVTQGGSRGGLAAGANPAFNSGWF